MQKSFLQGKDNEALPILIGLHASPFARILDVTYNDGKMWKGLSYDITSMDINPDFHPDVVGDFTKMPFPDASFDVIVFDLPHIPPDAASLHASKIYMKRYGITADREKADHVCGYFAPFLKEAHRVLTPTGIVLAKLVDIVHNHKQQWQHVEFINAVTAMGTMTPCDMLVKADPSAGRLISSKWKNTHHLRKAHCYWIVVRNGHSCE